MNFTKKTTDGEKWRYYSKTKPHIEKEEPKPDTTRDLPKYQNKAENTISERVVYRTPSSDKDRLRELEEYKITSVKIENGTISLCHKAPVIWVEYVDEEVFFWCSECGKLCEWERIKQI